MSILNMALVSIILTVAHMGFTEVDQVYMGWNVQTMRVM